MCITNRILVWAFVFPVFSLQPREAQTRRPNSWSGMCCSTWKQPALSFSPAVTSFRVCSSCYPVWSSQGLFVTTFHMGPSLSFQPPPPWKVVPLPTRVAALLSPHAIFPAARGELTAQPRLVRHRGIPVTWSPDSARSIWAFSIRLTHILNALNTHPS